jgi:Chaperone of endosialidase
MRFILTFLVSLLTLDVASAQNCPGGIPHSFTNNTSAVASQVNDNFLFFLNCVNNNLAPLASPSFTGNVGIGTATPSYLLDVRNTTAASQVHVSGDAADDGGYITAFTPIMFMLSSAPFNGAWIAKATTAGQIGIQSGAINFYTNSGLAVGSAFTPTQHMSLTTSGQLIVLNSAGGCTFTPITPTWSCSSDARLKKDIADTGGALPQLADIRVRDFTIKSTGDRATGVIAQELKPSHPGMVHEGADGFYTVDAPNPWMLVKAIQELKAENDELRARLTALESIRHASLSK